MKRIAFPAVVMTALISFAACGDNARPEAETAEAPINAAPATTPAAAPAETPATGALIDPNDASREQLLAVPGITEATADALTAGRPYQNMLAVDSILAGSLSETQRDSVYARLWHPLDLNTASGEEIQLIPGVGDRMEHEFEEYRPYTAIAQFRREIGKYVDDAEVARLEKYVTIR